VVDEVRGSVAELLAGFGKRWCGDERTRAHWSGRWQWWLDFLPGENERGRGEVRRHMVARTWFFPSSHR
jgi:hypothetical protein